MFILALVCIKSSPWNIHSSWLKQAEIFAIRAEGEVIFDFKNAPGVVIVRVPSEFDPGLVLGWFSKIKDVDTDLRISPFHEDPPVNMTDLELLRWVS